MQKYEDLLIFEIMTMGVDPHGTEGPNV